jgi:hypothetical protein
MRKNFQSDNLNLSEEHSLRKKVYIASIKVLFLPFKVRTSSRMARHPGFDKALACFFALYEAAFCRFDFSIFVSGAGQGSFEDDKWFHCFNISFTASELILLKRLRHCALFCSSATLLLLRVKSGTRQSQALSVVLGAVLLDSVQSTSQRRK